MLTAALCIMCNLYLGGGVSAHAATQSATKCGYTYWLYDENRTRNPYGIAAIGYDVVDTKRWHAAVEIRHESSLDTTRDRGVNELSFNVTWHPFR